MLTIWWIAVKLVTDIKGFCMYVWWWCQWTPTFSFSATSRSKFSVIHQNMTSSIYLMHRWKIGQIFMVSRQGSWCWWFLNFVANAGMLTLWTKAGFIVDARGYQESHHRNLQSRFWFLVQCCIVHDWAIPWFHYFPHCNCVYIVSITL